jgi:hypothetical protein
MSHEREEKDRAARAKARAQMGSIFARPERREGEQWPRLVCGCGEAAGSVEEVLLCKHEEEGR